MTSRFFLPTRPPNGKNVTGGVTDDVTDDVTAPLSRRLHLRVRVDVKPAWMARGDVVNVTREPGGLLGGDGGEEVLMIFRLIKAEKKLLKFQKGTIH